jgi:hypothetical protein
MSASLGFSVPIDEQRKALIENGGGYLPSGTNVRQQPGAAAAATTASVGFNIRELRELREQLPTAAEKVGSPAGAYRNLVAAPQQHQHQQQSVISIGGSIAGHFDDVDEDDAAASEEQQNMYPTIGARSSSSTLVKRNDRFAARQITPYNAAKLEHYAAMLIPEDVGARILQEETAVIDAALGIPSSQNELIKKTLTGDNHVGISEVTFDCVLSFVGSQREMAGGARQFALNPNFATKIAADSILEMLAANGKLVRGVAGAVLTKARECARFAIKKTTFKHARNEFGFPVSVDVNGVPVSTVSNSYTPGLYVHARQSRDVGLTVENESQWEQLLENLRLLAPLTQQEVDKTMWQPTDGRDEYNYVVKYLNANDRAMGYTPIYKYILKHAGSYGYPVEALADTQLEEGGRIKLEPGVCEQIRRDIVASRKALRAGHLLSNLTAVLHRADGKAFDADQKSVEVVNEGRAIEQAFFIENVAYDEQYRVDVDVQVTCLVVLMP